MTTIDNKWLVSEWDAGQSYLVGWNPDNVKRQSNGSIEFTLDRAEPGDTRPYDGAELQSLAAASTGTWTWMAQTPDMVDGAIFGMFLYQDDYRTQPWREYDIEFVGENTSQIRLAVHFLNEKGQHVTLKAPSIIELGFDASKSMHLYGITLTSTDVRFTVDGVVVESFDASDIQGEVWDPGPLNGLTDLWVAAPEQAPWSGTWVDPGRPLVARVDAFSLPSDSAFVGGANADTLIGTSGVDQLYGNGGNDRLDGRGGADIAFGGAGDDLYFVDSLQDQVREYSGQGRDQVNAGMSWTLADHVEVLALQGSAAIDGTGNWLANTLIGNGAANRLNGQGGNDRLAGNVGADTLTGGSGHDTFIFAKGHGADVITDFRAGGTEDRIEVTGYTGYTALRQEGLDTRVVFAGSDSILLKNVIAKTLTTADFGFPVPAKVAGSGAEDAGRVLTGSHESDRIVGNAGSDTILGKQGTDRLFGRGGDDLLGGGKKRDVLTGGGGDDTFRFRAGDGRDRITDFDAGGKMDRIEIHGHDSYETVQRGDDLLIRLSAKDSILLDDVRAGQLTDADFLFV